MTASLPAISNKISDPRRHVVYNILASRRLDREEIVLVVRAHLAKNQPATNKEATILSTI